jgi:hypothetical protein
MLYEVQRKLFASMRTTKYIIICYKQNTILNYDYKTTILTLVFYGCETWSLKART